MSFQQGQECDTLSETMPFGCLVATTTASILLLTLRLTDGQPSIQCRNFKTPQGLLGSISRRMSSLIFGSHSAHQSIETRLIKLLSQKKDRNTLEVQILCSQTLQCWQVKSVKLNKQSAQNNCIYHLVRLVKQSGYYINAILINGRESHLLRTSGVAAMPTLSTS